MCVSLNDQSGMLFPTQLLKHTCWTGTILDSSAVMVEETVAFTFSVFWYLLFSVPLVFRTAKFSFLCWRTVVDSLTRLISHSTISFWYSAFKHLALNFGHFQRFSAKIEIFQQFQFFSWELIWKFPKMTKFRSRTKIIERTVDTRCLMCLLSKTSTGCYSLGENFQHFYRFSESTNLTIFQLRFTFERGFTKFRKVKCNCSPAARRIIQILKKYARNFLPIQWFCVLRFLGTWSQWFHGNFEHLVVQRVDKFVFCG